MAFPVDLLADVSQTELERSAHSYMNQLLFGNPDAPEHLILSDSSQVTIDISSVGFVPLYGSSDKQRILALFTPKDPLTAVALYLLDRWWTVDTILKTADSARDGPIEVETVGERIVLYILNRVIYRAKEMSSEELPFLCHGEKDHAKILWNNGEAVGFYSVKPTGSFCNAVSSRRYQLPVMDSIFVRKCQRGKGFGLQMLEDFVLSFKEDCLGLKYPLTKSMYKVCEKYLCQYPGDTGLLWEVESIGSPNQRTSIASKIHTMDVSASKMLSFTQESLVITEMTGKDVVMEAISTQVKEAGSMECTVEIVEEVTLLSATRVPEGEVPLTARARSSGSKIRKMGEKSAEEKVIRIEDIEAGTPREEQQKTQLHVSELHIKSVVSLAPEEQGQDGADTAPEEAATVLSPQYVPTAPQAEGDEAQDLNEASCDSQIAVENVASEVGEESQQDDAAELEVCKDAETEGTEIQVTEERVTQHETNLPTHETSEDKVAGKTTTVQSKTLQPKSRWLRKLEDGVKEKTSSQDGGLVLRGRTLQNTPPPRRKYIRRSQKVCEEVEQEVDEVAEERDVSTTELVEEMSPIKEDVVVVEESTEERLEDEGKTEKQQEAGEEGAAEKEQIDEVETPVIQNEQDVNDDETDEPPAGDASSEETAEEQVEEHHQVEQDISTEEAIVVDEGTVPNTEEAAEDVLPSTKLKVKENNEVPEKQETGAEREEETVGVTVADDTGEPQDKDSSAPEIPKLQKATIILVDIKATCHGLSVEEAEKTPADVESAHPEQQREEEGEKQENAAEKSLDANVETVEKVELEEESVRNTVDISSKCTSTSNQQQEDGMGEGVAGEEVDEAETDAGEVMTKTSTGRQVEASGEEDDGRKPVMESQEVEQPAAVVTRSLRSGAKMSKATPKTRSRRGKKQQAGEEEGEASDGNEHSVGTRLGPKEPEGSEVEEEEAGLGSAEEPPTEGDEGKAPEDEDAGEEKEEVVTAEAEKEEATIMTEEEKGSAAETETLLPKAATDSAAALPTPSADKQQSEDRARQVSDFRRVTVVLVDLQKPHQDVHGDTTAASTAAEVEEQQREGLVVQENLPVEEHICEDQGGSVTTQDTEEEGAKSVDEEEQEPSDTDSATQRRSKEAVEATPRTKSTRLRQKGAKTEKEAASEIQEEEAAVQGRVLRRGRKSVPVQRRRTTRRNHKQLQEEEEHEGEGQCTLMKQAREDEEEEERKQTTDEEMGERHEEGDATETLEHVEANLSTEKQHHEDNVLQQDGPEPGQADRPETAAETVETAAETAEEEEIVAEAGETAETVETTAETAETVETAAETAEEEEIVAEAGETAESVAETVERAAETAEEEEIVAETVERAETVETAAETAETAESVAETVETAAETAETVKLVEVFAETLEEVETVAETEETAEIVETAAETVKTAETEETAAETVKTAETVDTAETEETAAETVKTADTLDTAETEETAAETVDTAETKETAAEIVKTAETVDTAETVKTAETLDTVAETDDGDGKMLVAAEEAETPAMVERDQSEEGERAQETPSAARDEEDEETAVTERVLRSGGKTMRATRRKTRKRQADDQEEEKSTEEGKQRKSAPATLRRKSKRGRTEEEEEEEEASLPEGIPMEETKAVLQEAEKMEEKDGYDAAAQEEGNTERVGEVKKEEAEESVREQETAGSDHREAANKEEAATVQTRVLRSPKTMKKQDGKQEQERETRVMRKGRKSVAATPRHKSKSGHTEEEEEEEAGPPEEIKAEEKEEGKECPEGEREEIEEEGNSLETEEDVEEEEEVETREEDEEQAKDDSAEEAAVLEEEGTSVEAVAGADTEAQKTTEEAPTLRSQTKRKNDQEEVTADSPRRSVRKRPRVDYKEDDEEGERGETDEEEAKDDNKKAEHSSDPDEEVEAVEFSQEDEEDEQNMSEEEVEPAMTGTRVLRGRSLPSVMIDTPSKSRRSSAKMSNEEKSLRFAQKRKRPEVTVSRRSQRLSRF